MRCWITGILGFLGSQLAIELAKQGHLVRGNDNMLCSSANPTDVAIEIRGITDGVYLYDSRDYKAIYDKLRPAISPPGPAYDVLIHCAATAHEGLSNFSPSFITKNIYEASVTTFSAAIAAGVRRIVFMSSMARYGNGTYTSANSDLNQLNHPLPFKEHYHPMPIDPYGIAKVAAEQTLIALCKLHGVEYVIAVPHNIIGAAQNYSDPYRNVASIMINRALQGKSILIYGDGEQKRCFSPIADCLDSLVKMIDAPISGEIINIGPDSGEITINQLADKIIKFTGSKAGIEYIPGRPNEVKEAFCSSDKARKLLGFKPKQSLDDCLKEMVAYIRDRNTVLGVKEFAYNFPIEISKGCPEVWLHKRI